MAALRNIVHRLLLLLAFLLPAALRWRLLVRRYRRAQAGLRSSLAEPQGTQLAVLRRIVESNRGTEFGRAHAFDQVQDQASFRTRVPLRTYSELEPFIERQRLGEPNVLVSAPCVGFAITGGSRGRPKPVLVTGESLHTWAAAEALLAREAIRNHPAVARGSCLHLLPCYTEQTSRTTLPMAPMSVLAATAGAPTGLRWILPHQLFALGDERLRYYLILRLAMRRRVSVLRAACPGTLIILAEYLEHIGPQLVEEVASGRVQQLEALPDSVRGVIPPQRPDQALATRLGQRLSRKGRLEPTDLWPDLSLLICSTTGSSQVAAGRLSDRFGNLPVMDPGYRAAEGILTWAWLEGQGGLPLLDGQYLEFLRAGSDDPTTAVLGELEVGQRYVIVLTGFNGMYRYVMDDIVEVIARTDGVPRFAIVGRSRYRIRLPAGSLDEETVTEAIAAGARNTDVVLGGYTVWLAKEELSSVVSSRSVGEGEEQGSAAPEPPVAKWGWLAKLLRRSPQRSEGPRRPMLTLALEPASSLGVERAKKLLAALDAELRKRSPAYDSSRGSGALDRPCLILLKPQTLSRARRRRLAEGTSGAHASLPVLAEDGWLVEHEDVELQL
jgi:hypothetical protein